MSSDSEDDVDIFDVNDKVVLIFGGTSTLGSEIALWFANYGANVIVTTRTTEKGKKLFESYSKTKRKLGYVLFDAEKDDVSIPINSAIESQGKIDVLINACGVNSSTPFEDIKEDEIEKIMKINYTLPSLTCSAVIPYMKKNGGGSIINIGSISALTPLSRVYTYSASKAALHSLTKNLAREYGKDNIRVNTLVPGFFPAEQNKKILSAERVSSIVSHTPMGRFGKPQELVGACIFLSSSASSFVTGSELVVDGGFNACKI